MRKTFLILALFTAACSAAKPKTSVLPEYVIPNRGTSPFSSVVRVGNLLFVAGQLGTDSARAGIAGETTSAMLKIGDLLKRSGSSLERVAKCTIMMADMKEWAAMNEAYLKFFPDHRPARSSFGATALANNGRVEIECIATVD
jgi:2-iminobutanoate/2-iminopropanoate deaminase